MMYACVAGWVGGASSMRFHKTSSASMHSSQTPVVSRSDIAAKIARSKHRDSRSHFTSRLDIFLAFVVEVQNPPMSKLSSNKQRRGGGISIVVACLKRQKQGLWKKTRETNMCTWIHVNVGTKRALVRLVCSNGVSPFHYNNAPPSRETVLPTRTVCRLPKLRPLSPTLFKYSDPMHLQHERQQDSVPPPDCSGLGNKPTSFLPPDS